MLKKNEKNTTYTREEVYENTLKYFKGDTLATDVWMNKYAVKNSEGVFLEKTPNDMHKRMADEFARIEQTYEDKDHPHLSAYGKKRTKLTDEKIYDYFKDFKYISPQGSIMSMLGNQNMIGSLSNCFVAGTNVLTTNGIKRIEDVIVGDVINTQTGELKPVIQTHKNKLNGRKIYELKVYKTPTLHVTENHKFLSISKEQLKWGLPLQENTVEYLREGDYIAIPKQREFIGVEEINITSYLDEDFSYEGKDYLVNFNHSDDELLFETTWLNKYATLCRKKHQPINKIWKIDNDFMYFMGLWYGDGCIFSDKKGRGIRDRVGKHKNGVRGITFTFNSNETKLIKFVSEYGGRLFGLKADVNDNKKYDNSCQIVFHSVCVGIVFEKLFGRYSDGKRMNEIFYGLNDSLINSLIQGLVDSDGLITREGDVRITLRNKSLIQSFYHLLRNRGVIVGYSETKKANTCRIDFPKFSKYIDKSNKFYADDRVENNQNKKESALYTIQHNGYTLLKIKNKDISPLTPEYVYTLGIKDIHSYNVEGLVCMNCVVLPKIYDSYGGIMYTDQQLTQLFKRRCGVGIDISTLRPADSSVTNAAGTSTGAISFMDRFSNTTREVGQCLIFDSKVLTKRGLVEIKDVISDDYVWTKVGWVRVIDRPYSGKKNILRIKTKRGFSIGATKEHIFLDANKSEKKLGEFKVGDEITMLVGSKFEYEQLGLKNIIYETTQPESIRNLKQINQPQTLNNDLSYLLGYSYGDGHFSYNHKGLPEGLTLTIFKDDVEITERLKKIVNNQFNLDPIVRKGSGNCNIMCINSMDICSWLIENGLNKEKTNDIVVPKKILQSPSSVQLSFFSGYFDADGTAHKNGKNVRVSSTSKMFLKDIQTILLSNGIVSNIQTHNPKNTNHNTEYRLNIQGSYSQSILKSKASSIRIDKMDRISLLDNTSTPYEYKNDFRFIKNVRKKYPFIPTHQNRRISLYSLNRLYEKESIYDAPLFLDEIVSIEPIGEFDTYDLILEKEHLFWCDGFYVHNSGRRGALMISIDVRHPDIFDFVKIKRDLKKITGANISIMLRDDFMDAVKKGGEYTLRFPVDSDVETAKITKTINAQDLWDEVIESAHGFAEPGFIFKDRQHVYSTSSVYPNWQNISTNPCQPSWAKVLTPQGIRKLGDVNIGDKIWSSEGWTTIVNKFSTGIKDVYKYSTTRNVFYGTEEHRVVSNGEKVEVKNANTIDSLTADSTMGEILPSVVMDGIVLGDGSVHVASNNLVHLDIGTNDYDYFDSIIADLILKKRSGLGKTAYEIKTSITSDELPKTFSRKIPDRFYYGDESTVRSFLMGLYTANGSIVDKRITLKATSFELVEQVRAMLSSIGIKSYVTTNKTKLNEFSNGTYVCKESYDLNISRDREIFYSKIGFIQKYKMDKLKHIILNINKVMKPEESPKIIKTDFVSTEEVFDITVDNESHTYWSEGCNVSNCSEIAMNDDSCRLMVVNYFGCVENPFTEFARFDFDKLYEITYEAQRLIDDLVDLELEAVTRIIEKIKSDPEPQHIKQIELDTWNNLYEKGRAGRRTGLGFTGIGDVFASMGMPYDSDQAMELLEKISQTKFLGEFDSSIDMAIQRGKFADFNPEHENKSLFVQMIRDEHPELYERMMKFGRRNISVSTVAPTGSLSILTQTTSGIEPLYMIGYKRRKKINPGDKNTRTDFIDDMGDHWTEFDVLHPRVKQWMNINNIFDTSIAYADSPYVGSTAPEIDWLKRVKIQSIVQKYTTHSISSTINLPSDVTKDVVSDIYLKAWQMGLKGITVYRDGSRSGVLISDADKKEMKRLDIFKETHAPKRPKRLKGEIIRFQNNLEKWVAVVGLLDGRPYELFTGRLENGLANLPVNLKECEIVKNIVENERGERKKRYDIEYIDSDGQRVVSAGLSHTFNPEYWNYAKLISGVLRHGMPLPSVYDIFSSLNLREENINTWKNGVARIIKKYIKDGEKAKGNCLECGSGDLEFKEGCLTCSNCGSSACS
jgi:ribonucleotide reductase alpha subunit